MGAQVSCKPPPPLPGGYVVGEQVYYTGGAVKTFENGDRLEPGKQGEGGGPTIAESHKGKGVKVRFAGITDPITCYLTEVRRLAAPAACVLPPHSMHMHMHCHAPVHADADDL